MQNYNKEAIYDEQVSPLMAQIIAICNKQGIQMVASFALMDEDPAYDDEPMQCTSYVPGDTYNNPSISDARAVLMGENAKSFTIAVTRSA